MRVEKSHQIFRSYRLVLSGVLLLLYFLGGNTLLFTTHHAEAFLYGALAWFLVVAISTLLSRQFLSSTHKVTTLNFVLDMIFLAFLGYASGGVESGVFYLMLPSAALAGLITPYRLALFIAAVAAMAALYAQVLVALQEGQGGQAFVSAGILGALLFGATITFSYLESALRKVELRAHQESRFKEEARNILGKVVSPQVAETLIGKDLKLGGAEREISVMFTDIRNFTSLSSMLSARDTLEMLNRYFTCFSDEIEDSLGIVDKYLGDGAMAFFGAPMDLPDHADRAIRAALRFQLALEKLNAKGEFMGHQLVTGIGINSCTAVVGNLGSRSRMNYTAIGDGVNLAARIEQLTKVYGLPVLVSETTSLEAPRYLYREVDLADIRGLDEPVRLYQPLALPERVDDQVKTDLLQYEQALQAFKQRNWQEAEEAFADLKGRYPQDPLLLRYLDSIAVYREQELPQNWVPRLKI